MVDVAQLAGTGLLALLPVIGPPVHRQGNLTQRNISKQMPYDNQLHYDACLILRKYHMKFLLLNSFTAC